MPCPQCWSDMYWSGYKSVHELIINTLPEKHNLSGIAICQIYFDIEKVEKH